MDTLSPPGETKFVLKFTIQVSFHISIKTMNMYKMNNDNFYIFQSKTWSYKELTFLEIEFNHFPSLKWAPTLWDTIDPYLLGGLPLVDLVDLLT